MSRQTIVMPHSIFYAGIYGGRTAKTNAQRHTFTRIPITISIYSTVRKMPLMVARTTKGSPTTTLYYYTVCDTIRAHLGIRIQKALERRCCTNTMANDGELHTQTSSTAKHTPQSYSNLDRYEYICRIPHVYIHLNIHTFASRVSIPHMHTSIQSQTCAVYSHRRNSSRDILTTTRRDIIAYDNI